jgi:hypothetical protein
MSVMNLLFFFSSSSDMRLPYVLHFTYLNASLPAGLHESPVRLQNVKAKRSTVCTRVLLPKMVCKNAEEVLCISSIRLQSVV